MRKEHNVCRELKRWFESSNIKCWLNEGDDKFIIKGERRKPDLVIYSEILKQYIVIEVKSGDVSKDIMDASKIIEYYKNYYEGKTKYFINNKEIIVSSFAVASFYSMFGKLFKNDGEALSIDDCKDDKWKVVNKERGLEPQWEYPRTHDYLRNLWGQWRKIRERKQMPGLGIILSDVLNNKELYKLNIGKPILFDMQWELINMQWELINEGRWKVRQKWL